ncbi:MAG: hemerythrin domain-containing protein [Bacteroidetes bacterium]|nr:hemerythrin domain-containing protein [Bacteroidota bacterium]MBS1633776.1 hemerythrin domain-containing protein [Bacteroidota bacterium]
MSENKPIKRHEALVSFSKDHHFGLLLAWKIRQGLEKGVSTERISNYVIYIFENDLDKHFIEEEKRLFILLPASDELRKKAEEQHKSIFQQIAKLKEGKALPSELKQLADELDLHFRFEERELFNHLQQTVPQAGLDEISTRLQNDSRKIDDAWKDIFW